MTFLPYADFVRSARCLDDRRLGKQRVEACQILRTLNGTARGWRRHPTVLMWRGYEAALGLYLNACIDEWERRGFANAIVRVPAQRDAPRPWWLGWRALHASHRARLLAKAPAHYRRFRWRVPRRGYVWPVGPPCEASSRPRRRRRP